MSPHALCIAVVLAGALPAAGAPSAQTAVAHWEFDGDLTDSSGRGNHGQAASPTYANGRDGQALTPDGYTVTVPSSPSLQLYSGLKIECWIFFTKAPDSYTHLIQKSEEYQLRVDHPGEGGRYAFFVYSRGWEPRVRCGTPAVGRWQHIVAEWTGTEIRLSIDGETSTGRRPGAVIQTDNPVVIGGLPGRIDDLRISNPKLLLRQWLASRVDGTERVGRLDASRFGGEAGWPRWAVENGTRAQTGDGCLTVGIPDGRTVLANTDLDVDVRSRPYLLLDLDCPGVQDASLTFATDKGYGEAPVPL